MRHLASHPHKSPDSPPWLTWPFTPFSDSTKEIRKTKSPNTVAEISYICRFTFVQESHCLEGSMRIHVRVELALNFKCRQSSEQVKQRRLRATCRVLREIAVPASAAGEPEAQSRPKRFLDKKRGRDRCRKGFEISTIILSSCHARLSSLRFLTIRVLFVLSRRALCASGGAHPSKPIRAVTDDSRLQRATGTPKSEKRKILAS